MAAVPLIAMACAGITEGADDRRMVRHPLTGVFPAIGVSPADTPHARDTLGWRVVAGDGQLVASLWRRCRPSVIVSSPVANDRRR